MFLDGGCIPSSTIKAGQESLVVSEKIRGGKKRSKPGRKSNRPTASSGMQLLSKKMGHSAGEEASGDPKKTSRKRHKNVPEDLESEETSAGPVTITYSPHREKGKSEQGNRANKNEEEEILKNAPNEGERINLTSLGLGGGGGEKEVGCIGGGKVHGTGVVGETYGGGKVKLVVL